LYSIFTNIIYTGIIGNNSNTIFGLGALLGRTIGTFIGVLFSYYKWWIGGFYGVEVGVTNCS